MRFTDNQDYMSSIQRCGYAHVTELAYIALRYNLESQGDKRGEIQDEFSRSFLRVIDTTSDSKVQISYWKEYAEIICEYEVDIPESMVQFAEDIEKAEMLVETLYNMLDRVWCQYNISKWKQFCSLVKSVFQKIILLYPDHVIIHEMLEKFRAKQELYERITRPNYAERIDFVC